MNHQLEIKRIKKVRKKKSKERAAQVVAIAAALTGDCGNGQKKYVKYDGTRKEVTKEQCGNKRRRRSQSKEKKHRYFFFEKKTVITVCIGTQIGESNRKKKKEHRRNYKERKNHTHPHTESSTAYYTVKVFTRKHITQRRNERKNTHTDTRKHKLPSGVCSTQKHDTEILDLRDTCYYQDSFSNNNFSHKLDTKHLQITHFFSKIIVMFTKKYNFSSFVLRSLRLECLH